MSDKGLVISLWSLPPAPGERLEKHLEWTVPVGWETEVLELPEGTVVPVEVELTSIDDGVLVQARAEGSLRGNCVRCLEQIEVPFELDAAEVYVEEDPHQASRGRRGRADADIEVEGDELDQPLLIENGTVDLEPLLRDGILGAASLQPVCGPTCPGLCPHCGIRMADAEPGHEHEFFDPRFAALEDFFAEDGEGGTGESERQ